MKYVAIALLAAAGMLAARAMLLRTLSSRLGIQRTRAAQVAPTTARQRVGAALAWPVFFVAVALVLALGLVVGSLVGPH